MPHSQVILHERLGHWAGQLRPRFSGWPIVWAETRSTTELVRASRLSNCPIVLIDLADRPLRGLEDLERAIQSAPSALALVLDPADRAEVAWLARELGGTLVLGGLVVPPVVESLLRRWVPLAQRRAEREGWAPPIEPRSEPWDVPDLFDLAPSHPIR